MLAAFYKTLGVFRGCTDEAVKAAWDRLRRELHPDALMHEPGFDAARAAEKFQEAREAYVALASLPLRELHLKWMVMFCEPCADCSCSGRIIRLGKPSRPCPRCGGSGYLDPEA